MELFAIVLSPVRPRHRALAKAFHCFMLAEINSVLNPAHKVNSILKMSSLKIKAFFFKPEYEAGNFRVDVLNDGKTHHKCHMKSIVSKGFSTSRPQNKVYILTA